MSLQDRLDAFRANFEAGGPPYNAPDWIHEPMHRTTEELIASSAADKALKAAFRLRFKLPGYLADIYKNVFKNDLEVVNGDPSWTLPMPARFVIAPDRTILYAEVNPDYTRRPDPQELLPVLDRARSVAA